MGGVPPASAPQVVESLSPRALANCPRTTNSAASIYDRCKAGFEATIPRYRPLPPRS